MTTAPPAPKPSPVLAGPGIFHRVFSFPVAIAGLLVVLAVLTMRSRFDDPDMWWHLKTGEVIWTTHAIPTTDIFSYTTNHHAYIPHEWLAQLSIFAAYKLGGYSGLMLWLCFFTSAILIAGYALCSLYSGNAKVAFLGAIAIWLFGTIGFSIRPQTIGYLLLVAELLLLHLGRTRNPRWFLALPPLFALWVNCHGSFPLGIAVAAILLFSSWFSFQRGSLLAIPWDAPRRRMLTWALALSVLALFLNPVGVKQVLYPLNLMLHQPINLGNVQEWQPLRLSDPRGLAFLATLGGLFLFLIVRRTQLLWHELLLLALGAYLAATHERMLFVFGILAAPILSRVFAGSWDRYDARQDRPTPNLVLIAASLLVAFWAFPSRQNLTRQVEEQSPAKAVDFIHTHHLSGPMLNDWISGGYLIWAAPDHPVFIDGRADVFEWSGVMTEFGKWATLQSPPSALLDKYQINFCILSRDSSMAFVLPLLPNWSTVYSDDNAVIFVRIPPVTH
ncbi:MAG: hypothetical protein ABSG84_06930 [Acidobacteriaceae bacterium]